MYCFLTEESRLRLLLALVVVTLSFEADGTID